MAGMSRWKKINLILTWPSVALLLLVLVLILRKSPAPDVPYDANAAARAEQKFEAAEQAKAAGRRSEVDLDPPELNAYLRQNLDLMGEDGRPTNGANPTGDVANATPTPVDPTSSIPGAEHTTVEEVQSSVKDVKVDMVGDLIKAYVVFVIHGKELSLELNGHLHAEDGYLHFDPVSGKIGSLPLPKSTLDSAVQRLMTSPENREKLRLPSDVADIQIVNGQAVVVYK